MLTKKIYTFVFRIDWGIFFMVTLWSNSPGHRWGKPRPCRGTRHREQAWGWTGRRTEQRGNSFTSHGTGRGLLVLAEPRKESLETFPSVQATVATGNSGVNLHLKNTTQRARPRELFHRLLLVRNWKLHCRNNHVEFRSLSKQFFLNNKYELLNTTVGAN